MSDRPDAIILPSTATAFRPQRSKSPSDLYLNPADLPLSVLKPHCQTPAICSASKSTIPSNRNLLFLFPNPTLLHLRSPLKPNSDSTFRSTLPFSDAVDRSRTRALVDLHCRRLLLFPSANLTPPDRPLSHPVRSLLIRQQKPPTSKQVDFQCR
ncbi:hypothetical protein KFK09_028674 [Dendrobium nobile]|uniref:Uncharacterized protein n=1 Tax=Dendrobium nobile TaxID=94219 RepID=A0A8T3A279_DENNO|nr:hypothetical protein KFK09_028674 [Dendrobium nobile]